MSGKIKSRKLQVLQQSPHQHHEEQKQSKGSNISEKKRAQSQRQRPEQQLQCSSDDGDDDDTEYNEGGDYDEFNREYFENMFEHEKMLADKERMKFYYQMIEKHVVPGTRVLDLGTGTGVLAAFAARRGAKVVAIDHSPVMIEKAQELIDANSIEGIEFRSCHSTELSVKSSQKFDVILHEQMGDILFDEMMLPNVIDARDRLLKPAQIPTQDAEPGYYHFRSSDASLVDHYLCGGRGGEDSGTATSLDAEPILRLSLETIGDALTAVQKKIKFSRSVTTAGRMDGLAVYFKVKMDPDLVLCTGPLEPRRAVHWGYRVLRVPAMNYNVGDILDIVLKVRSWEDLNSWRWTCTSRSGTSGSENCNGNDHVDKTKELVSKKKKQRTDSTIANELGGNVFNNKKAGSGSSSSNINRVGQSSSKCVVETSTGAVEFMTMADLRKLQEQTAQPHKPPQHEKKKQKKTNDKK